MPGRFHESDTEMLRNVGVYTKSYTEVRSREYRFIWSRVNKPPIRYEIESDTLVIRYRVMGPEAFIV